MSGEQKTTEELEVENERLRQAYKYIHASRNSVDQELNEANKENAALKESLEECIGFIDEYIDFNVVKGVHAYPYYQEEHKKLKAAIDRAKKLLSDKTG